MHDEFRESLAAAPTAEAVVRLLTTELGLEASSAA
jgi:hypothetical protein